MVCIVVGFHSFLELQDKYSLGKKNKKDKTIKFRCYLKGTYSKKKQSSQKIQVLIRAKKRVTACLYLSFLTYRLRRLTLNLVKYHDMCRKEQISKELSSAVKFLSLTVKCQNQPFFLKFKKLLNLAVNLVSAMNKKVYY